MYNVSPKSSYREQISAMTSRDLNVHDDMKHLTVPELRNICDENRNPFAVCAMNLTGELNVGSILRTSCLFGAEEVIFFGRRKFDKRSTVGAQNYIPLRRINGFIENSDSVFNADLFINIMNEMNYVPVFIEHGGIPLSKINWQWSLTPKNPITFMRFGFLKPCLIVGNENAGIPSEILETKDSFPNSFCVSIPQKGVLRSHNVSAAAAIVMWDLVKGMKWG